MKQRKHWPRGEIRRAMDAFLACAYPTSLCRNLHAALVGQAHPSKRSGRHEEVHTKRNGMGWLDYNSPTRVIVAFSFGQPCLVAASIRVCVCVH